MPSSSTMSSPSSRSWLSPRLEVRRHDHPARDCLGVFAREAVPAGELLSLWSGEILPAAAFAGLSVETRRLSVQVEDEFYLVPARLGEGGDHFNHSCAPNAGMEGQLALRALQDIAPGEEVCYDYAMSDGSAYDEFNCHCGAANCRGRVTGEDWRRPELQQRYGEAFSPYLLRRIRRLRQTGIS